MCQESCRKGAARSTTSARREGNTKVDQRHTQLDWQRSSRCSNGSCVEAARTTDAFLVRDSKETGGPILRFGRSEWTAFISAVKAGEIRGN